MAWGNCYNKILPYVFAVETPEGSGSGVFFMHNDNRTFGVVATAAHVVQHAHEWKLPIKLRHHSTRKEVLLTEEERVVYTDYRRDSASILFVSDAEFNIPEQPLTMLDADKYRAIGTEVAWVGYPSIATPHLCFFSGRISAFIAKEDSYLIDGVAIHGVSGGPVFMGLQEDEPQLLGTVSAYRHNRLGGDALPGLLKVQDVTPFHETIKRIRDLDEARKKQEDEEAKKKGATVAEVAPAVSSESAG